MTDQAKPEDERVTVTEEITFFPDGSSHHVWKFPNGTSVEKSFKPSPVLFIKPDLWPPVTAAELGITGIVRKSS